MEKTDEILEKQNQQTDLSVFKFKENENMEELACNYILSFFESKQNEGMDSKVLLSMILEQIIKADELILSDDETEEHSMLDRTRRYLKIKIDELKSFELNHVTGNTFNDCMQYLKKLAQDSEEEQIKSRLYVFINELTKQSTTKL